MSLKYSKAFFDSGREENVIILYYTSAKVDGSMKKPIPGPFSLGAKYGSVTGWKNSPFLLGFNWVLNQK